MPYKIAGQPGTWYEPGTRKGNATVAWRGQLPDGKWTEFVTDAGHRAGAQAFVRRFLEKWHRDRPPAAGTEVALETAAHHYKAAMARSDVERDRIDQVVALIGGETPVKDVNQTHLTAAARKFRERRALENARAAEEERQTFPPPSTGTVNREVTTPLRSVVNFASNQGWRSKIVLMAVKADEGELPSQPRPAARDQDVDQLLKRIDHLLDTLRPTGKGRDLNFHRKVASLKALRALVLVVHERGYRISEWLRWEWETVNLQDAMAKILLSKPKRWVEFDIGPEAVAALASLPSRQGRVFPWVHRSNVYSATDKLGIHWRPHESRRAVVTAVMQRTGDPVQAQKYVSHASVRTTLRYRVVDPDETRPEVRAVKKS